MAQTFQQVLQKLLEERQGGIGSINALAKRFSELHGGTRENNRKQIRRHLGSATTRAVEPEEEMIARYAKAFSVARSVFPPAVSPRQARARALEQVRERLERIAKTEPHLRDELAEIQALLPDPPVTPKRPTKPHPRPK